MPTDIAISHTAAHPALAARPAALATRLAALTRRHSADAVLLAVIIGTAALVFAATPHASASTVDALAGLAGL